MRSNGKAPPTLLKSGPTSPPHVPDLMATGAIQYLRPIHLPTASRITLAENIAGQFLDPVGIIRLRLCRQSERLVDDQRLGRVMCSGNSQHLPATAGHIPIETGLPKSLGQCDDASSAPQQRREQFARCVFRGRYVDPCRHTTCGVGHIGIGQRRQECPVCRPTVAIPNSFL